VLCVTAVMTQIVMVTMTMIPRLEKLRALPKVTQARVAEPHLAHR
jgi:hypothetical protein